MTVIPNAVECVCGLVLIPVQVPAQLIAEITAQAAAAVVAAEDADVDNKHVNANYFMEVTFMSGMGDCNLSLSKIYMDLVDTDTIVPEHLIEYKKNLKGLGKEYNISMEQAVKSIMEVVEKYLHLARIEKRFAKKKLLESFSEILNLINTNFYTVNAGFYLKMCEYKLCDNKATIQQKIDLLKSCIPDSDSEPLDIKIRCRAELLNLYMLYPENYLREMRTLSDELKPLIALRDSAN